MYLMVLLVIANRDGLTITVVKAPFALKRGGASPVALCCLLYDSSFFAVVTSNVGDSWVLITKDLSVRACRNWQPGRIWDLVDRKVRGGSTPLARTNSKIIRQQFLPSSNILLDTRLAPRITLSA